MPIKSNSRSPNLRTTISNNTYEVNKKKNLQNNILRLKEAKKAQAIFSPDDSPTKTSGQVLIVKKKDFKRAESPGKIEKTASNN